MSWCPLQRHVVCVIDTHACRFINQAKGSHVQTSILQKQTECRCVSLGVVGRHTGTIRRWEPLPAGLRLGAADSTLSVNRRTAFTTSPSELPFLAATCCCLLYGLLLLVVLLKPQLGLLPL
jgi:hypothetical protein